MYVGVAMQMIDFADFESQQPHLYVSINTLQYLFEHLCGISRESVNLNIIEIGMKVLKTALS